MSWAKPLTNVFTKYRYVLVVALGVALGGVFGYLLFGVTPSFFATVMVTCYVLVGGNLERDLNPLIRPKWRIFIWPWTLFKQDQRGKSGYLKPFLMILITAASIQLFLSAPNLKSLPEAIGGSVQVVSLLMITYICFSTILGFIYHPEQEIIQQAYRLWARVLSFFAISAWVRFFAGELVALVNASLSEPGSALYLVLVLVLFWVFRHLADAFFGSLRTMFYRPVAGDMAITASPLTQADIMIAAAHEAGHAVVYAGLGNRQVEVTIFGQPKNQVLAETRVDAEYLWSKRHLIDQMLRSLARPAAEQMLLDDFSTGAIGDTKNWQRYARLYFENGFRHLYLEPKDTVEATFNATASERLRREQLDVVTTFLEANRDVLGDVAGTLQEQKRLGAADLHPFFERLTATDLLTDYLDVATVDQG